MSVWAISVAIISISYTFPVVSLCWMRSWMVSCEVASHRSELMSVNKLLPRPLGTEVRLVLHPPAGSLSLTPTSSHLASFHPVGHVLVTLCLNLASRCPELLSGTQCQMAVFSCHRKKEKVLETKTSSADPLKNKFFCDPKKKGTYENTL